MGVQAQFCDESQMLYSSRIIDITAVAMAVLAVLAVGYFLFRAPVADEPIRPEICREIDLELDLRRGRTGRDRLSMSEQETRNERCKLIMRGIGR